MSSGPTDSSNRILALRELKFKKISSRPQPNGNPPPSQHATPVTTATTSYALPPQSRDGSVRSHYFPFKSPGTHEEVVLAPDSSPPPHASPAPTGSNLTYTPHQSHFTNPIPKPSYSVPLQPKPHGGVDPLTASSGFTSKSFPPASPTRTFPVFSRDRRADETEDDPEPPRKRINRGDSKHDLTIISSPEIKQYPSRRKGYRLADVSDSDDMPDPAELLPGIPKPRIVRGRRPQGTVTQSSADSVELNRFIMTNPDHPRSRVVAAYNVCDGDVEAATLLILDPDWNPTKSVRASTPPSSSTPSANDGSGNRRAEEKEKGRKSMIYAKRQAMPAFQDDSKDQDKGKFSGVFAKRDTDGLETGVSLSPSVPKPSKRKAPRRVVDSSGSEAEYSDGSNGSSLYAEDESYNADTLKWFNNCEPEALIELAGITSQQAETLISLRPFSDAADLKAKLSRKNKTGLSSRILEQCSEIFRGYRNVDDVLQRCERIADDLRQAISRWDTPSQSLDSTPRDESFIFNDVDGALALDSLPVAGQTNTDEDYISTQSALLASTVQLKEYQLLGVNWMNLLYKKSLSCILADEMGLGKTVQVIAFLALLKEKGSRGPHLIIVPSSTLENWIREFDRFAPPMEVQAYYGSQKDRIELRSHLSTQHYDVLITTYNLAQGDERDRKFFRKFNWECCIFDEGHVLKNFDSQRYHHLMKIDSRWRLLLTGTPLQNNLQELVSLMNFILPRYFTEVIYNLRAIFRVKADRHLSLLSRDRISRAKKMMMPFVLRRRKDTVLKELPKKTERIEWCEMTSLQKSIYRDALQRSRKAVLEATGPTPPSETDNTNNKGKRRPRETKKPKDTSTNVLMDLRKAASHPMLFRRLFDDEIIKVMARKCMKEPEFRASNYNFIVEDMEVMTDAELQTFSLKYKSTRKFARNADCFLDAGKISKLLSLLDAYDEQGRRVLIFSQFTQILDILQAVLKYRKTKFLVLTGSTAVDVRQALVDEFNEDNSIPVFLLSTKAGGMGINLTAASVVVLFDQDFNPHNDRQAADRAYRIGQKRDVDVIKLITRSTIEEDMYRLGQTKLALDEAVAGDGAAEGEDDGDEKAEKKMKTSLLSVLRDQFEKEQHENGVGVEGTPPTSAKMDIDKNDEVPAAD